MKIVKAFIIFIILAGLLLGLTPFALATDNIPNAQSTELFAPQKGKGHQQPWFDGKIKIIQGTLQEIGTDYVKVNDKEIAVTEGTKIHLPGHPRAKLSDIEEGSRVAVLVNQTDSDVFVARRITVIPMSPGQPASYRHHVGEVVGYTAGSNITDGSITIKDKQGNTITFTIIHSKFKVLPFWHDEPKVGDWVTVISRSEPRRPDELIALGVVVHPRKPAGLSIHLESISGVVQINGGTIIVNVTPPVTISYDDATLFILRGIPSADGQMATVLYETETDGTRVAKFVLVGIDLPGVMARIRERLQIRGDLSQTKLLG